MKVSGDSIMPWRRLFWSTLFLAFVILLPKMIYLYTAESTFNAEETAPIAVDLVAKGHGEIDIGSTRLYGASHIIIAVSLWLFGFSVFALKAPTIFFFLVSLLFLYLVSRRLLVGHGRWLSLLPVLIIALGPPVAQMWGVKARTGFIEPWCIFTICLWLYLKWQQEGAERIHLLLMGLLCGIAVWMQPIALTFTAALALGVFWEELRSRPSKALASLCMLSLGVLIGVLPLVSINFMYEFNTFRVLDGGEYVNAAAASPGGRATAVLVEGIPRILGLKQQWKSAWVVSEPFARLLYLVIGITVFTGFVVSALLFYRERRFSVCMVVITTAVLVLAGNVMTSWGGFQGEPRRLLLLYVPLALLSTLAIARFPKLAFVFIPTWFGLSAWSNYSYVSSNLSGFASPVYRDFRDITASLASKGIGGVYTDVWTGNKISFSSSGQIAWYRFPYMPSSYGYISDGSFGHSNAAVFDAINPENRGQRDRFISDLEILGIRCAHDRVGSASIIYACDREFNIAGLMRRADQVRRFSAENVVFASDSYSSNAFDDMHAREQAHTWSKPDVEIPFVTAGDFGQARICLQVAEIRSLDGVSGAIDGTGIDFDRAGSSGYLSASIPDAELAPGPHKLRLSVSPFVPALHGSRDNRALGLPLKRAWISQGADCGSDANRVGAVH